jgi:hypothetical protein
VPVVRDSSGRRVGFFDVNSQAFLYEAQYLVQIEARATHPSEVSTWPAEYQAYFSDPWRYSGMEIEREADQFIAESRRALFSRLASEDPELVASVVNYMRADGLLSNGGFRPIQAVEQMSAEELLWATIILNAETQEATVLTPNEIRGIMGDGDAVVWRWTEVKDGTYIRHGMWHDFSASAPDESLFEAFSNFSYEMEVFGSRVTVPHYASHVYTGGRLVGIVELPGGVGTGILLAYKDQGGGMHLQVYHAIDWGKSVQFDETMELCVGSVSMPSDLGQTKMLCPNTEVRTILQRGTNYMNAPRVQDRLSPAWLAWPGYPAKVAFGAVSYYHRAYQAPSTVLTFHHPDSGIEIVRQLTVDFPSDKP